MSKKKFKKSLLQGLHKTEYLIAFKIMHFNASCTSWEML